MRKKNDKLNLYFYRNMRLLGIFYYFNMIFYLQNEQLIGAFGLGYLEKP